jgi:hypothetical protein
MHSMVKAHNNDLSENKQKPRSALNLLATCNAMHNEVGTIFYSVNWIYLNRDSVIDF